MFNCAYRKVYIFFIFFYLLFLYMISYLYMTLYQDYVKSPIIKRKNFEDNKDKNLNEKNNNINNKNYEEIELKNIKKNK